MLGVVFKSHQTFMLINRAIWFPIGGC